MTVNRNARIGYQLKALRLKNMMSQEALGSQIHKTKGLISAYEGGRILKPNLDVIQSICELFGVDYTSILQEAEKSEVA